MGVAFFCRPLWGDRVPLLLFIVDLCPDRPSASLSALTTVTKLIGREVGVGARVATVGSSATPLELVADWVSV